MPRKQVRYAVVGLGHIAQVAVLPAFGNSRRNSKLAALVSGDPVKLEQLGNKYGVQERCSYAQYDALLGSGAIDAVYIALPNSLHCDYAVRAAKAGVHVLVEKPMALTEEECERMARAARDGGVKLMVAYRLHFERANLEAIEVARSGRIGEPHLFSSTFSMHVVPGNIRAQSALGGVDHVVGLDQAACHRLLDQHVHAGGQERQRKLPMALGRHGERHRVHLAEDLAIVGRGGRPMRGGDVARPCRVRVDDGDQVRSWEG